MRSSGHPGHPDSFPTRRSSDLAHREHRHAERRPRPWKRPGSRMLRAVFGLDRKSTRLNSSHVAISYAVFCLKKKKPPQKTPPLSKIAHYLWVNGDTI